MRQLYLAASIAACLLLLVESSHAIKLCNIEPWRPWCTKQQQQQAKPISVTKLKLKKKPKVQYIWPTEEPHSSLKARP